MLFDCAIVVVDRAGHVPALLLMSWGVPFYLRGLFVGLSKGTFAERCIFVFSWFAILGLSIWFWIFVLRAL